MIDAHPYLGRVFEHRGTSARSRRNARTRTAVVAEIAALIAARARGGRLLDLGAGRAIQTLVWRDQLPPPARAVVYDAVDNRDPDARRHTEFREVELDGGRFPERTNRSTSWSRTSSSSRSRTSALRSASRGGCSRRAGSSSSPSRTCRRSTTASCSRSAASRRPCTSQATTSAASRPGRRRPFLRRGGAFWLLERRGIGLHPFTSAVLPPPLRTYSHTLLWLLQKPEA